MNVEKSVEVCLKTDVLLESPPPEAVAIVQMNSDAAHQLLIEKIDSGELDGTTLERAFRCLFLTGAHGPLTRWGEMMKVFQRYISSNDAEVRTSAVVCSIGLRKMFKELRDNAGADLLPPLEESQALVRAAFLRGLVFRNDEARLVDEFLGEERASR